MKSLEDTLETTTQKTHFVVCRKFLKYVLDYLLREKCYDDLHGWDIIERSFEHYSGSAIAGNYTAEKIIALLYHFKVLAPLYYCPTTSQRAFTGVVRYNKKYLKEATSLESFPVTGFSTHFKFQVDKKALADVLAAKEFAQK